jgi:uncharacterized protein YprB with RNaseH-like and TPR domain
MDEKKTPRPPGDPGTSRLKKRLGYLQPARPAGGAAGRDAGKPPPGGGWERVGEYTWRRQVRKRLPASAGCEAGFSPYLVPPGTEADRLMVYDTETTGLSGGAGSLIFLMGTGWLEKEEVCYEQIFLADFPGERQFLQLVEERLSRADLLVSYNGKGFDSHLLRTRFALAGSEFVVGKQLDLLYWARRLWKRLLGDCSLGNIERRVLGVRRGPDIPGYEIPGVYLNNLRSNEEQRLRLVFDHNIQDLDSLFRLLFICNQILTSRESPVKADQTALGSYLVARMDSRGAARLESGFREGDQRAGRVLSLFYKRRQRWDEAAAVWEKMTAESRSLFAAVELAKYYEHRRKEPVTALHYVETALRWNLPVIPGERRELEKRKRRLQQKLERSLKNGNS